MTNGEIIQKDFTCKVCEPIPEDDIVHVIFSDKSDSAIGFDWSWWNMEYKEPTTKNDLGIDCISRKVMRDLGATCIAYRNDKQELIPIASIDELPSVTPQEPKTGHWISRPHVYGVTYCLECDFELKIGDTNYCPNCGARMNLKGDKDGIN